MVKDIVMNQVKHIMNFTFTHHHSGICRPPNPWKGGRGGGGETSWHYIARLFQYNSRKELMVFGFGIYETTLTLGPVTKGDNKKKLENL